MQYKICKSFWSKFIGLMFSKKKNLLFIFNDEKIRSLHMFFVFFPIDLIFLDKNKKVIEIKKNFRPFTVYTSKKKAMYIIESTDKKEYRLNEKIKF